MQEVSEFPDGFFFIRCEYQPYAIDVYGGSMTNDANIIIWPQKMVDSINQVIKGRRKTPSVSLYKVEYSKNDYYLLVMDA
ncbi:uncharacterized protein BX663DRAFT_511503 [Cokeromyces recurvatus]|uniref:uncharacterized protein n=1 Tax=Cokeromyces recurvatus TaxID=90255 RepID=UPI00221E8516|nr:uncharacterized protein BX663DRAFT_511503 [Cokeromyces recurvatus]KAI7902031.1 hypothetical protein BX663DRAFT_511503 [Cokeromyces recurvatus]